LIVEKISHILDQPFADSSIVPTYLLAKFAREKLAVALSGDGGDEVFGGYDRYLAAPFLQRVNPTLAFARKSLGFMSHLPRINHRKFSRLQSQLHSEKSLASRYSSILSLTQPSDVFNILNPDVYSKKAEINYINQFIHGNVRPLDRMIRSDFAAYLPGDLLVKIDLATMANSLELRSPMLDVNVVEWGVSLPVNYKIKGFETKHILKDVARSLVPSELIDRPKMGFGFPRAEWLRTGMKEMLIDTITDTTAHQRGWFNSTEVKKVIESHMNGESRDSTLWPILMLELWARTWLD
jgi:asparagine synthase (glutamine-hydrolysing)